jgi:hypothetical protein
LRVSVDVSRREYEDPSDEIANIDDRLLALQNFLKAAKQGGGAT